jgi:chromosome segregation ATPase
VESKDSPGVIEMQLRAWGAELDRLKAKVDKQVAEAKKEYYEHLEELRRDIEDQLRKWGPGAEGATEPSDQGGAGARSVLQDLRAKLERELRDWGVEIEALGAKAGRAEAEAKRLIEDLKERRKVLKKKLGDLKDASGGAWEELRVGILKAWDELRPALQSAIAKFK